jgi:hypothetical protein
MSVGLNIVLQLPNVWKYHVGIVDDQRIINDTLHNITESKCAYKMDDYKVVSESTLFTVYAYGRELLTRILPCIVLAFLNVCIVCATRYCKGGVHESHFPDRENGAQIPNRCSGRFSCAHSSPANTT